MPTLVEIGLLVLEKKIFQKISVNFYCFAIISPWGRVMAFICTILHSLYLKMICTNFGWNWPVISEEDFKFFLENFYFFCYYLPLGKGIVLHLYNSESPLPKDDLCQLWLKLAQRFWRRSWKCKSLTDRQTDDGQRAIRKAHLSFQLRWDKKLTKIFFHVMNKRICSFPNLVDILFPSSPLLSYLSALHHIQL